MRVLGGRSSLVAHVYNSSLYIFGGYNGSIVLNDFYEFRFAPVTIPPSTMLTDLRKLMHNPQYSDVTFSIDNQNVYANRAPLAARSAYFMKLFFENNQRQQLPPVIQIDDMQHRVF